MMGFIQARELGIFENYKTYTLLTIEGNSMTDQVQIDILIPFIELNGRASFTLDTFNLHPTHRS
jgi:hypothetical protein